MHGQDRAAGRRRRPGPAGGHAGPVGHRPGIGVQTRVRRAASAAAAGAVQRRRPARPAGPGPVRGARPRRGPRCSRPAPYRGGRPDPALGSVRTVPGPGGRRRRPLAGPQLAGGAGLRRQPPGRRAGGAAGGRPGAGPGRLLDGQPRPPRGRARAQVLAQAAGNPMALIELATVIADDPAASRRWAAEPLPLTDRLTAVLASRFAALPEPARAALLRAAVADGPDLSAAASRAAGLDARALAPAEQAGLITVDRTGLRFSHPLVRAAIYHSAPFARKR